MSKGIYKITNNLTQVSYIGQSQNIEHRWTQHQKAKDNYAIHKAIQKYGVNNFTFEIIELCDNLFERERYWISYYNTYLNGYNETPGGEGVLEVNKKPVNQYSIEGIYLNTYSSIMEAEMNLGLTYNNSGIHYACLNKDNRKTAHGFQWRYVEDYPAQENISPVKNYVNKKRNIIYQYDLDKNLLGTFDNITVASKETGVGRTSISNCVNNYSKTAGGYIWKKA